MLENDPRREVFPERGRREVYVITSPPPIYHRYLPIQFLDLLE